MAVATRSTHTQSGSRAPRKRKVYKKRTPKSTQFPHFTGQATFSLANDMIQLPFRKPAYKSPKVAVIEEETSANVLQCSSCGVMTQACSCDPLMKELDELEKDARRQDSLAISLSLPAAQTSGLIPRGSIPSTFPWPPYPLFNTYADRDSIMLLEPQTRPITQEQLVNEVKGIYAGLVMVEKKCVEIDRVQASTTNKLSDEQWQALIALHRTLLHEHHDFFLATQHPLASPALRDLAGKYQMPSRMWEHGINGFLKSVRHQMPGMAQQMLAYLNFAYSILERLSVQVPSLAPEWVECIKGLNLYCKELQRILQPGPSSSPPSLNPNYMEHKCRALAPLNMDGKGPMTYPDVDLDGLDGFDDLPSNLEPISNSSSSTDADQEADAANRQGITDTSMPQLPWDAALSQVASLVLAGWLWVGQGSSLNFNIFVKVFCILAMSDLA